MDKYATQTDHWNWDTHIKMINCGKWHEVYVRYNNDESRKDIRSMNVYPIL